MKTRACLVGLTVLCACFEDFTTGGDGPPGSSSSSGATTSETSVPGTDTDPTTPPSGTSSGSDSQGQMDSTSASDASSSGDAPSASCWGSASAWTTGELDVADLEADNPEGLVISPDGLTLWFAAGLPDARVPYESSRSDLDAAFGPGSPVAGWPAQPNLAQPRLAHEAGKAVARVSDGLSASLLDGRIWGPLQPVVFPDLDGGLSDPSLTSDGEMLLFGHRELLEKTQTMIWVPYVAQWPELSAPPKGAKRLVLPTFERAHAQLCPTIAPDGRHLLVGGSFPETWSTGVQGDLDIFVSDATGTGWTAPVRIEALSSTELHACPTSITADGCTVLVRHFDIPFTSATFVLGQRDPR